jgi:hypothetical protein
MLLNSKRSNNVDSSDQTTLIQFRLKGACSLKRLIDHERSDSGDSFDLMA